MKALIVVLIVLGVLLTVAFSNFLERFLEQQEELNFVKDALRLSLDCEELPQLICK